MKDAFYIKLDTNAPEDPKVKVLRKYHGMAGFGCYIFLALKLRQEENCQLEYGDFTFEALSVDMAKTPAEIQQFIDDCIKFKLLKKNGDHFYSERINRDKAWLDEKRGKLQLAGKISADKRWGKGRQEIEAKVQPPMPGEAASKGIAKMIELYEEKTGHTMTPNDLEVLKDIADNYKQEDFEKALDEAVNNKAKRPITYIAKVLENWKQESKPKQPVRRTYDDGNTEGMVIL